MRNRSCQYWCVGRIWAQNVFFFINRVLRNHYNLNVVGVRHNISQFSTDMLLFIFLNQLFLKSPEGK